VPEAPLESCFESGFPAALFAERPFPPGCFFRRRQLRKKEKDQPTDWSFRSNATKSFF